ncbi:hypothetical protein HAX54_032599 [Datura stramonium]|uniref:Uncharacterized protein n=1 Tax=Datura stramonium TaxID=4076 RepID=A0ABS8SCN9_DATST|nr:hypothetical protein [Datura stramonium]
MKADAYSNEVQQYSNLVFHNCEIPDQEITREIPTDRELHLKGEKEKNQSPSATQGGGSRTLILVLLYYRWILVMRNLVILVTKNPPRMKSPSPRGNREQVPLSPVIHHPILKTLKETCEVPTLPKALVKAPPPGSGNKRASSRVRSVQVLEEHKELTQECENLKLKLEVGLANPVEVEALVIQDFEVEAIKAKNASTEDERDVYSQEASHLTSNNGYSEEEKI